jgi:hypothetical protein
MSRIALFKGTKGEFSIQITFSKDPLRHSKKPWWGKNARWH